MSGRGPVAQVELPERRADRLMSVNLSPDVGQIDTSGVSAGEVEVSVVMPCLNEAATLEVCIRKARAALDAAGIRGEIVIGDNGSADGSQEIARRLGARVVDVPERGYGAALQGAIRAARGRYVVMGDSDDIYDWTDLTPYVLELRRTGRNCPRAVPAQGWPADRTAARRASP